MHVLPSLTAKDLIVVINERMIMITSLFFELLISRPLENDSIDPASGRQERV
jgi:hypothetical protein